MASASASFYIVLPSNTNVEGNRTNSFRVHLPRKLQFNSQWSVGLAVLVYPHSWPSLGTAESQFVRVEWQTGEQLRIPVPAASVRNPLELLNNLHQALGDGSEQLASELRTLQMEYHKLVAEAEQTAAREADRLLADEEEEERKTVMMAATPDPISAEAIVAEQDLNRPTTAAIQHHQQQRAERRKLRREQLFTDIQRRVLAELVHKRLSDRDRALLDSHLPLGLELWIHSYRKARMACQFHFDESRQRFRLKLDKRRIRMVELSAQLAYILGFPSETLMEPVNVARYQPDMKGGVSTFYVYSPGLIEPVIIGDVCAPVMRVVNIRGAADEMVEECYTAVQYHKLVVKEISEIFIEIRTPSGTLMPFQYGTCTLTLHFKKTPYF